MSGPKHASKALDTATAPGDALRTWWAELGRVQKWGFGLIGFALMALVPVFTPAFLDTPGVNFDAVLAQFAMIALVAIGLNVVVGQAGLLDLGYVGFYAVGAYTVALLTSGVSRPASGPPPCVSAVRSLEAQDHSWAPLRRTQVRSPAPRRSTSITRTPCVTSASQHWPRSWNSTSWPAL